MRVHELAKEYKIKSTDFVDIVQSFGISIKSHLNSLDEAQVADIRFKMDMKDHTKEVELLSAEEIRKHAETYKRDQVVKMERSGFWGWLKGFFG